MQSGTASPDKAPAEELPPPPPPVDDMEGAAEAYGERVKQDTEGEGKEVAEMEAERGGGGRKLRRRRRRAEGSGVVMVKRELLVRCMTCPLCHRVLRDATTISECLHTFCRKCIYKKLNDEELDCCPKCKTDLGVAPVEKLRADHNIQDVRSKIFPLKRKKVNAEVESPIALPVKRKERSISSLVVNTPRITTGLTGRRTRAVTRKAAAALRDLGPMLDPVEKDTDNTNKHADDISLLDSLTKVPQTRRKILSNAETSNHSSSKDKAGNNNDWAADLWKPLNSLVEAASKTKSFRSSPHSLSFKENHLNESPTPSEDTSRDKTWEHPRKSKFQDDKKDVPLSQMMLKRKGPGRGKYATTPSVVTSQKAQTYRALTPVWFSLIASFDQKGDPPLPQIPAHYLRIIDGSIPASSIQRYIMQKLSLQSESEVEMSCCGQAVNPIQPLRNLIDRWLRVGPARPLQTVIGSSGGDYVMVISYGRPKSSR